MPHQHHHHEGGDVVMRNALRYDLLMRVWGRRGNRWRDDVLAALDLQPGQRALDVASGTGQLAVALAHRVVPGGSVSGVDASPEMVTRARRTTTRLGLPITFRESRAQELPFEDGTFDTVTCTLALHHIALSDRSRVVAEMHRVLAPGGRLLVAEMKEPTGGASWLVRHRFGHHLDEKPLDQAVQLMTDAGFGRIARTATPIRWIGKVVGVR